MSFKDSERDRLQERLRKLQQTASTGKLRYAVRLMLLTGAVELMTWALLFMLFHWKFDGHFDRGLILSLPTALSTTSILWLAPWNHLQNQIQQLQSQLRLANR